MSFIRCCILVMFSLSLFSEEFDIKKVYKDASGWEGRIKGFEKRAAAENHQPGAIVCVGSSSMRMWHKRIEQDLAPLTIIKRGFGGSNYNDALTFADRIITNYKPRAVLVYEGDNDIAQGVKPLHVALACKAFVDHLRSKLPDVRVYVISVKPSIARERMWKNMDEANQLMKKYCGMHDYLEFIDVAAVLNDKNGKVKQDIFIKDNLHLNEKGYDLWAGAIKEVLLKHELKYEKKQ